MTDATRPVDPTDLVTIPAAELARLREDAAILDLYDTPGLMFAAGGEVRRRGRIMLRSRRSAGEYAAFLRSRGAGPCPGRRRPSRAS